jgi:hypothetical protein
MSSESLYERGMYMIQKKKEIVEINNEEKARKELEEVYDFPEINYKSKLLIGERDPLFFHEYSVKWLEDRNKKIEETRKETLEKERRFSPIKRAGTPPGYQSILTDWESRVNAYYDKKNQCSDVYSHMPEINSASKAMLPVWNEKVEQRLARLNHEKHEKIEEMRKKAFNENIPTFSPSTNPFNKPRPEDVSGHLYQEGMAMLDKKKKAIDMCLSGGHSFMPSINENSRALAANRKIKPKPESVIESQPSRVLKPEEFECFLERNYIKKKKKPQKIEEIPETTKKTPKMMIGTTLYEKEMKRISNKEQKRLEILKAREESELDNCTFKPKVINRIKTPPPALKLEKETLKNFKYCKNPSNQEYFRYEDKTGKVFQLKTFFHTDKSLLERLESLEKRVQMYIV